MQQVGLIKSVEGKMATVQFAKKSGCGGNCGGCGAGCKGDLIFLEMENKLNLNPGDKVMVGIQKKIFSKMVFWAYIFPSVMFILGLSLGIGLFKKLGFPNFELYGSFTGFGILVISYLFSSKVDKNVNKKNEYQMEMLKKVK